MQSRASGYGCGAARPIPHFQERRLTNVTDTEGKGWKYAYDPATHALVSQADPDGNVTRQFRMKDTDILGKHGGGSHVNFEILDPATGKIIKNIHTPLLNP